MAIETSYSHARAQFASLLDSVVDDREVVIVNRRGKEGVAMIAEAELSSLVETVHLLRSPKNAKRLIEALHEARSDVRDPSSIDQLRTDLGIATEG